MRNPAFFRGPRLRRRYFEGWYFKCISADRKHAVALIPGIALSPEGEKHAFIQLIDAVSGKTQYFRYAYDQFSSAKDRLFIQVGENIFQSIGVEINIDQPINEMHQEAADKALVNAAMAESSGSVKGNLVFSDIRTYPVTSLRPGIMGPFTFVPFMECYHAIVHLSHRIQGYLEIDGSVMDFDGGTGYIEKDYGRSFPRTYVWLQAGHFDAGDDKASFVFSRARIPFMGSEFPGFFAYLTDGRHLTAKFATYNRSELEMWQVDPEKRTCRGAMRGPDGLLEFEAAMSGGGVLRAPVNGMMDRDIIESITAAVNVKLTNKAGNIVFESQSHEAGMEICL